MQTDEYLAVRNNKTSVVQKCKTKWPFQDQAMVMRVLQQIAVVCVMQTIYMLVAKLCNNSTH